MKQVTYHLNKMSRLQIQALAKLIIDTKKQVPCQNYKLTVSKEVVLSKQSLSQSEFFLELKPPNKISFMENCNGSVLEIPLFQVPARKLHDSKTQRNKTKPNSPSNRESSLKLSAYSDNRKEAIKKDLNSVGALFKAGNFREVIEQCQQMQKLYDKNMQPQQKAKISHYKGASYEHLRDRQSAINSFERDLELYEKGDSEAFAKVHLVLGCFYAESSQLQKAMSHFKKALKFSELMSQVELSLLYSKVGDMYRKARMYENGVQFYRNSLEIEKLGRRDSLVLAKRMVSLANCLKLKRDDTEALNTFKKAVFIIEKEGYFEESLYDFVNLSIADLLQSRADYEQEINLLLNSMERSGKQAEILLRISSLLERVGNMESAQNYYNILTKRLRNECRFEEARRVQKKITQISRQITLKSLPSAKALGA